MYLRNDAWYGLAEHVGGTYENFIPMINEKGKVAGKMEVMMKKRSNFLKMGWLVLACAFILTGCSNYQSIEVKMKEPERVIDTEEFVENVAENESETERELELEPIISCCSGKRNF